LLNRNKHPGIVNEPKLGRILKKKKNLNKPEQTS
jgi:hypothetical protein